MTTELDSLVAAARSAITEGADYAEVDAMVEAAGAFTIAVRSLDGAIQLAVLAARRGGASWADIGEALGVSRQAARERWHKLEEQT